MDSVDFLTMLEDYKVRNPVRFEGDVDPPATLQDIECVEKKLGIILPTQYKDFLQAYGGGYIGPVNIFSAYPAGDWYLPTKKAELIHPKGFLPVTDDETGGYYGFMATNGVCGPAIFYLHPDDDPEPHKQYDSFFDYVAAVAF